MIIVTPYVGADAETVYDEVTSKIESKVSSISNYNGMSSTSSEHYSMVMIEFLEGTNMDKVMVELREELNNIDFIEGVVTVNGITLYEPYIAEKTEIMGDYVYPLQIPEGYIFVMGDNRNESLDSRFRTIGLIDERYVLGVANARIFPFGDWNINDEK